MEQHQSIYAFIFDWAKAKIKIKKELSFIKMHNLLAKKYSTVLHLSTKKIMFEQENANLKVVILLINCKNHYLIKAKATWKKQTYGLARINQKKRVKTYLQKALINFKKSITKKGGQRGNFISLIS